MHLDSLFFFHVPHNSYRHVGLPDEKSARLPQFMFLWLLKDFGLGSGASPSSVNTKILTGNGFIGDGGSHTKLKY